MFTALNIGNCATTGNTSPVTCNIEPGLIQYKILAPVGTVVPNASLTSATVLLAYIVARLTDSNRATRWFLTPALDSFKDNTDADKTEQRDSYKLGTDKGKYNWEYRMKALKCDHSNMLNFHQQQAKYGTFDIDDQGNFIGTKATDSTGAAGIGVFSQAQIWVADYKQRKYGANNEYWISFQAIDNRQYNQNMAAVAANIVVPSLTWAGLADVALVDLSTTVSAAAHTAAISGTLACGSSFLAETYGATLAAAAAWQVYDNTADPTHAAPITPSGVTYVPPVGSLPGYYLFAFTVAPTATHVYSFQLAAPSVLLATPYFVNLISETAVTHTF